MCDEISISEATISDFERFFKIKSEQNNIYWTGHKEPPEYNKIKRWFIDTLSKGQKTICTIRKFEEIVGYLYLDIVDLDTVELAIGVSKEYQGFGIATHSLKEMVRQILHKDPDKNIVAWVLDSNEASKKTFIRSGFKPTKEKRMIILPMKGGEEIIRKYVLQRGGR